MGLAAAVILIGTHAQVGVLVVLYAINVFVTFTLSQLGMSALWWRERLTERNWMRKLGVNGIGCIFTAGILALTVTLKFDQGGWVTLLMTGAVIAACCVVRNHYERVAKGIEQLEADILPQLFGAAAREPGPRDADAPTAVLLVNGFNGLGLATLTSLAQLFENQFRNVVFVSVGEIDAALIKGREELERLEAQLDDDLLEYCRLAADLGFHAEFRLAVGTDVVLELRRLCFEVSKTFPHSVFFAGQLVLGEELGGFMSRFLHNHTAIELLHSLQRRGQSLVILPVRVGRGPAREEAAIEV
jgi:hypothetical protein